MDHAWVVRALAWDDHQDRIAVALSTDAIQTMRLEQANCGRTIQIAARETLDVRMKRWRNRGRVDEPPFSPFEAARLIQIGSAIERTARGLKSEGPGELPGEALHEWAAKLELAGHYHFAPQPCTPARGRPRAGVEGR